MKPIAIQNRRITCKIFVFTSKDFFSEFVFINLALWTVFCLFSGTRKKKRKNRLTGNFSYASEYNLTIPEHER